MIIIHAMNDNHADPESSYRSRWLTPLIRKAVSEHPVVIVTGARQVGKSTLLRHDRPFANWRYRTLDDFDVLRQSNTDPAPLWAGVEQIVLDEVQRAPDLLREIKKAVDRSRRGMRFVLSGSANLLLMQHAGESLAGRAVYFNLSPMTVGEIGERPAPKILSNLLAGKLPAERDAGTGEKSPLEWIARGLMPPLLNLSTHDGVLRWWEGYVATYLERDVRTLMNVASLPDFRRVMEVLANRTGQMLNQTDVARDSGVSQPSIHRYVNVLEASCLLHRVPAFSRNRTKRLIKTPKIYWNDAALGAYLSGLYDVESLTGARETGGLFENLVLVHLLALAQQITPRPQVFYWRTAIGKEVDFVVEHGKKLVAIEVKLSSSPRYGDADGLRYFMAEYPETVAGVLIHGGHSVSRLDENIVALPWWMLAY